MENPFVNTPFISNDCDISGRSFYVHVPHVVLDIRYEIKNQYTATRGNNKGRFILFVNKAVSLKNAFNWLPRNLYMYHEL